LKFSWVHIFLGHPVCALGFVVFLLFSECFELLKLTVFCVSLLISFYLVEVRRYSKSVKVKEK